MHAEQNGQNSESTQGYSDIKLNGKVDKKRN